MEEGVCLKSFQNSLPHTLKLLNTSSTTEVPGTQILKVHSFQCKNVPSHK